jgi:hypothetical protein
MRKMDNKYEKCPLLVTPTADSHYAMHLDDYGSEV